MTDLVPLYEIERIVGTMRHPIEHIGRAVSAEHTVYILHSGACVLSGTDLRDCPYSLALNLGIDVDRWVEDTPVRLQIDPDDGSLIPATEGTADDHR